ncbi:helix-turn-helix domain-containing protein [Priestia aryabhattai]|uniref:helix-turn-helix domain-containing protein n=1 Tax=Priestia aryabhattai TaxID=412384 RepID=UPI003D7FDBB9
MTRIEFLRREAGLSQVELAKTIGISSTAIVQVERGHRKCWPKLRNQLAQILKMEEGNLFDEAGWPKKIKVNLRGE